MINTYISGGKMKKWHNCKGPTQTRIVLVLISFLSLLVSGCSGTVSYVKASGSMNPPPKCEFSRYNKFIAEPVAMSDEYCQHNANLRAKAKIQENLDRKLNPMFEIWNKNVQGQEEMALVLKPKIEAIKFISGGARAFVGPFAGGSAVLMRMTIVDKKTGEVIANPEFYQHTKAMSGATTIGVMDNTMLNRITLLIQEYMFNNYERAAGGRTGADQEEE
jgi:hypothetical protein